MKRPATWVWPNRHTRRDADSSAAQGVELVEDVGVLVERRAVADLDQVVHDERTRGQVGQPRAMFGRQRVDRPRRRALGDRVELLGVIHAGGDLVVIAADDRGWLEADTRSITSLGSAP